MKSSKVPAIKKTIEGLSVADRLELFGFISDLPDSGIHTGNLAETPTKVNPNQQELADSETTDKFVIISTPPNIDPSGIAVIFKGKTIVQLTYHPRNYYEGRLKMKKSWQYAQPTEVMIQRVRAAVSKAGGQITDEQIMVASSESMKRIFDAMSQRMTNELAIRMPDIIGLVMNAAEKIIEISVLNDFSRKQGQFNAIKNLDQVIKELEPFWNHIKEKHLGTTQGGARNIKHIWTSEEHVCLKMKYDELRPIWLEAKKIAIKAQKSNEGRRRDGWRNAVLATYPELPADLLERFAFLPSDLAKPSDIALEHAARECIPVNLSTRRLRAELKKLNFKAP